MNEGSLSKTLAANATRAGKIIERCLALAQITDVPGETTRLFLSPATHRAHELLLHWMREAGLETRVDDVGSVRGVLPSRVSDAPTLLLFSHIDTVPDAGAFDGVLGVLVALSAIEELQAGRASLPFAIELTAFSEEEGVRFAFPFLSSLAAIGELTPGHLTRADSSGVTLEEAIRSFGLKPEGIPRSCPVPQKSFAALEVHIEQGPVLDNAGESLAVVEGVIGQSRMRFTFEGQSNHAGTTPMRLRHDALAAAAAWIVSVEEYASRHEPLVATVGRVDVLPGAGNVIPGRVEATLDVRHPKDAVRHESVAHLEAAARQASEPRGVRANAALISEQATVLMDAALTLALGEAARRAGFAARTMFSGAGHDAMILAAHVPTTMLFVRSPRGLSHHSEEAVEEQDVEAALASVLEFIRGLRP